MVRHQRTAGLLALAASCALSLGCTGTPIAPAISRLEVFVSWNQQGLPDRRLEIVELGLTGTTDARGLATFVLRPGSYTLRAYVNSGGPPRARDFDVVTRVGETEHVDVPDCVPCLTP